MGYEPQDSSVGSGQRPGDARPPGYPPASAPVASRKAPALATAGLVLAFLAWPVGLPMSLVALARSKKHGGRGVAIGGVVLGAVLGVVSVGLVVVALNVTGAHSGPRDAVVALNEAVMEGGTCEDFVAVTTESYRVSVGLDDCGAWDRLQADWSADVTEYATEVVSIAMGSGQATVETTETALYQGLPWPRSHTYSLVEQGGLWRVDEESAGD